MINPGGRLKIQFFNHVKRIHVRLRRQYLLYSNQTIILTTECSDEDNIKILPPAPLESTEKYGIWSKA